MRCPTPSIRHRVWLFFRACCALALALVAHPLHAADLRLDDKFTPTFAWNQPGFGYINSIKEQKDGKIVVGGYYTYANGVARRNIARLNVDGSLDLGFDPGTGVDNVVDALEVLPDNKIVVAGFSIRSTESAGAISPGSTLTEASTTPSLSPRTARCSA